MDPVSAGLGAVSLISGKNANKKAQKASDKAGASAQQMEQRLMRLWDTLFARAEAASKPGGDLDPEKRIANLEADTARYESRDLGNLTGAMRIGGYKPGDSEIGTRQDAVKIKYRSFLDNMRNEIRGQAFGEQTNAYLAAGGVPLGQAMGSAQGRQQNAQSQMQSPGGMFQGMLGAFRPKQQQGFNTSGFLSNLRGMNFSGA